MTIALRRPLRLLLAILVLLPGAALPLGAQEVDRMRMAGASFGRPGRANFGRSGSQS